MNNEIRVSSPNDTKEIISILVKNNYIVNAEKVKAENPVYFGAEEYKITFSKKEKGK